MTEPDSVRDISKLLFGNRLRLEVAAAIARDDAGVCHAAGLAAQLGVNNNQAAAELKNLERAGILERTASPGTRRVEYRRLASPFWGLASEVLRHLSLVDSVEQLEKPLVSVGTSNEAAPVPYSGPISWNADHIQLFARRLNVSAEMIDTALALAEAQVAPLSAWRGAAADAYARRWADWQQSSREIHQAARQLALALEQAADNYREAEADISAAFSGRTNQPSELEATAPAPTPSKELARRTEARILAPARAAGHQLHTLGTTDRPDQPAVVVRSPTRSWWLVEELDDIGSEPHDDTVMLSSNQHSKLLALASAGVRPDVIWMAHELPEPSDEQPSPIESVTPSSDQQRGDDVWLDTGSASTPVNEISATTAALDRLAAPRSEPVILGGIVHDDLVQWVILSPAS